MEVSSLSSNGTPGGAAGSVRDVPSSAGGTRGYLTAWLTAAESSRRAEALNLWSETVRGFHDRLVEVKSRATAEAYVYAVRLWEIFLVEEGIRDLSTARMSLLDDFVRSLLRKGVAPTTIASRLTGVKSWLEHLERTGYAVPKFSKPDLPKVWDKEPVVLTLEQLGRYFDKVNEDVLEPSRTAMLLMPLCGFRSDEVVRLRLDSFEVKEGWIVFSFEGKGRKPRKVPLLKQGNVILRSYLMGWRAEFKKPNEWLFPGHKAGTHASNRTIRNWADKVSKAVDIPELTPHVLRKTYSTMLDSMGVSPLMIAQLMGHSNLRTTSKSYIKHELGSLVTELAKVHVPGALLKTA